MEPPFHGHVRRRHLGPRHSFPAEVCAQVKLISFASGLFIKDRAAPTQAGAIWEGKHSTKSMIYKNI